MKELLKFTFERSLRRIPVENTIATINTSLSATKVQAYDIKALVNDITSQGCCLTINNLNGLEVGQFCRLTIGKMIDVPSQVRWVKKLDHNVFKLGVMFQV